MELHWQRYVVVLAIVGGPLSACLRAEEAAPADGEEAAYTRTITERAERIVADLGVADAAHAARVRDVIANQYRALRAIHDARDAKVADATRRPGDRTVAEAYVGVVRKQADMELFQLHRRFVARLAAELSPEQVDQVKDGMTYGVVPLTFRRYRELFPDLSSEQRAEILAQLLEAREYAMDAGSAEEKHGWFRKYKGRINNYLSAAGYDLKRAEQEAAARAAGDDP